jgi:hypothetical protein
MLSGSGPNRPGGVEACGTFCIGHVFASPSNGLHIHTADKIAGILRLRSRFAFANPPLPLRMTVHGESSVKAARDEKW